MSTERRPAMEPSWCVRFDFAGFSCYTSTFHDYEHAKAAQEDLAGREETTEVHIVDL